MAGSNDSDKDDIYDEFPEEIAEGFKNYRDQFGKPVRDPEKVHKQITRPANNRSDDRERIPDERNQKEVPSQDTNELEQATFLKEYAQDSTRSLEQVASFLQIPQVKAEEYLKRYIYLMINTVSDTDNPRRVRAVLNKNLPKDLRVMINDQELIALKPLVERYGDLDVINSTKMKQQQQNPTLRLMNQKVSNAYDFMSQDPNAMGGANPYSGPHMGMPPADQRQQHQENKPFATLSNSGRANLMRWVLERSPYVHYSKIDPFIELFTVNELKLMQSPDELYKFMADYFGPQAGKISFNQFKDMISSYLKPNEQFGANPYYGGGTAGFYYGGQGWSGGGGGGGIGGQPLHYYEAMGVLPPGVDPRTPEAKRAIWEFEEDRRKKKSSEEMQENIKNYVNLKMMDIVDPRARGGGMGMGGGAGDAMLTPLLMSGALRAVPTVGPDGQPRVAYENTGNVSGQNGQENTMLGMMRIMMEMYNGVLMSQQQGPKFMESILTTMLGKFQTQTDPFELAVNAKKLADTFNPPTGGVHQSIEVAKLLLARDKMSTDRDLTLQKMNFEHENEMYERKKADVQEQQSSAQTNDIVKSIFQIGGQALVPLLSMFMGRGGGAGGMPGIAGIMANAMAQQQGGAPGMPGMPPGMEGMMGGMGMPNGGEAGPTGNPFEGMMGAMSMGGGGGGGGMPPGMGGGMNVNPTMGSPVDMTDIIQRQSAAAQGNPSWFGEPSDLFGYGTNNPPPQPQWRPPTAQEQWANFNPEPQHQQVPSQQPQYEPQPQQVQPVQQNKIYQPEDFDNMSLEEIQSYEREGVNSRTSIDSFNNALRIAKQKKMFASAPQQVVQSQDQGQQQMFQSMPSNVSLDPESYNPPAQAAGVAKSILDDMTEAEDLLATDTSDLRVLPDTPMSEDSEKNKPNRSIQADEGDIG